MFTYRSQNQPSIFDFRTEFESKLSEDNRWVKLARLLDWDFLANIYANSLSSNMGAPGIDARVIIGALIIKHIENLDDRGTIQAIQENPYMQYFLGFDQFVYEPVFDPSLFVSIRKRLGGKDFDKMNQRIINQSIEMEQSKKGKTKNNIPPDNTNSTNQIEEKPKTDTNIEEVEMPNKGKIQLDATVADAYIKYPTDLNLLNDSREKSEELIDYLYTNLKLNKKPRTYRRVARKEFLNIAKKKNKSIKEISKGIKKQLSYLSRNINHINKLLDQNPQSLESFDKQQYKYLLVIQELHRQQKEMFNNKEKTIEDRIVSIHQPHIRPIVRGKNGRKVEFGSKVNISLENGYGRINQFSFNPFNEGTCLINQLLYYKKLHGCYPELVQADRIYLNRQNRAFMKEHGIRHIGSPLGRKPAQESLTRYQKDKQRKEKNERNHIEGKFGQGKVKYGLNRILARLDKTHESWVASIFFVMNILKLSKDYFWLWFKYCFGLEILIPFIFPQSKYSN